MAEEVAEVPVQVPVAEEEAPKRGFGRGRGRGRGRGGRRGRGTESGEWVPVTKLGRLVKAGKIQSLEEIFLFSLPVKEVQIIDTFITKESLKDEVMKIMPVQKVSAAGQRTRFKAFIVVGDGNGHIGFGVKCANEVSIAIRGAMIAAKLAIIPVRRGYWGNKVGLPHTVPAKITGSCGSVRVRLIPAPRGAGLVAAPVTKKVLSMAGIRDIYTSSHGHTRTMGNFIGAVFDALGKTYGYLEPTLWAKNEYAKLPYQDPACNKKL